MPTHFSSGVSNTQVGDPLYQYGMLDPTKWHTYFNDFDEPPLATEWTLTAIEVGAGSSTVAVADADGGIARITTAANEDDGLALEMLGESWLVETGKKLFMKTRFSVGDAIQSDMIIGLHSTDSTPLDATMRFAWITADGAATMLFNVDDNTTDADSSTLVTLADDTFVSVAAYWDGVNKIELYVNDVLTETLTTTAIPGAEMAIGFGYWNGAAGAETTDIDYILVAKER
jgi:hypothetical protein